MVRKRGKYLEVVLIDFGYFAQITTNGVQEITEMKPFRGNMLFSSLNQMEFGSTDAKDDLISLAYLLVYILNDQSLPGFNKHIKNLSVFQKEDKLLLFSAVKNFKHNVSL